jgi:bifunctional non-homologous end joining protein LigD
MSAPAQTLKIGRRTLGISNVDKPLYPSGFTKGRVIDYYRDIAPVMLPHLKDRAITLKRYPNGTQSIFFFEKNCPSHHPVWMATICVSREGDKADPHHCLFNEPAALIWAANLAALELHVPLGKAKDPDRPTCMVFDLDPGAPADMLDCCRLAIQMRDLLHRLHLQSFAKTSGSKGLHFYVPLNTPCTFDHTKNFARAIAQLFERQLPDKVTSSMSKSVRAGKIFIDWSQNDRHKTTVAVYSLRAKDRPTVSTPVAWKEIERALKKGDASDLSFETDAVLARVKKQGDLFEPVLKLKQKLPKLNATLGA